MQGHRGTSTRQVLKHRIRRLEDVAGVPNTAIKQERIQTVQNTKQGRQDGGYGECEEEEFQRTREWGRKRALLSSSVVQTYWIAFAFLRFELGRPWFSRESKNMKTRNWSGWKMSRSGLGEIYACFFSGGRKFFCWEPQAGKTRILRTAGQREGRAVK